MTTKEEWREEMSYNAVYIIEKDGVAVGDAGYEVKDNNAVYISGLTIAFEFQGQGIGRQALIQLLEILSGKDRITLATHPQNIPAIKLYESFGFKIESQVENYFGDGEPRIIMIKNK